jgi:hypothetical protein
VARKKKSNSAKKSKNHQSVDAQIRAEMNKPWLPMRSGLIWVAFASVLMAGMTAWQVIPEKGIVPGILWGLLFGVLIWAIFWGFYFFRRVIH